MLKEVVVSSTRKTRKTDVGNLKDKTLVATGGANQYAKHFLNELTSEGLLHSITFEFQPEAKKYGRYKTAILIRVYRNENGLPGQDVLLDKVVVPIKADQKRASVDLSKYNITFSAEGLFVGFDYIGFYDDKEIFTACDRLKSPANLRVEFAKADASDTFNKFFGTS